MLQNNILLNTDSYKITHWNQLKKGTTKLVSYLEARKGAAFKETIFFGLQYYLKFLSGIVFTQQHIDEAAEFSSKHFGNNTSFNKLGWELLLRKYGGKLPLKIKAVKEGTLVPIENVLMTIENTDPEFPWLTNYVESFLMKVWYPISVSTNSFYCKKIISDGIIKSNANMDHIRYALNDFGYRGVSSEESAKLGGMAHLVHFYGTDNITSIIVANHFYNKEDFKMYGTKMYGNSVTATEHSIALSFGPNEGELAYIEHLLHKFPAGILSIVIDTYNAFNFIDKICLFKEKILQRNGKIVLRPDSGEPLEIILFILNKLWNEFGGTEKNGFKLLNPSLGIIQGDGINLQSLEKITQVLIEQKWSLQNIVFGSGGGLLQSTNRDTNRFAIKPCIIEIDGQEIPVSKHPINDDSKASKAGNLKLIKNEIKNNNLPHFYTISSLNMDKKVFDNFKDELELVFENGELTRFQTFDEIRNIASSFL